MNARSVAARSARGRRRATLPKDEAPQLLVRAALAGQRARRLHALVPGAARKRLSARISAWVGDSRTSTLVDDWSRPLVCSVAASGPSSVPPPPSSGTLSLKAAPGFMASASTGHRAPVAFQHMGDRTRCLLATSALDAGGMDEMVAFLALRLRAHGFDTAVLHTAESNSPAGGPGRLARMLIDNGVEVAIFAEPGGRRWLRRWQPQVISAHGALPWVLDEARDLSVPYVDVLHGMHSLFDVDWAAEADRAREVAAIVAVSEHVRRQYLSGVPTFPPARIVTIPNGVDDRRKAPIGRTDARTALGLGNEFLFVSLARHCLQKNTFALVSAFEEVAAEHRNVHLLIAGRVEDPVYCTQVRRVRDGLSVGRERVHLREHAADPGLVLAAADGFVLNSFFEGWALASMEALHAGVPVVASDVGGAREQVGDGGSRGFVVRNPLGHPLNVSWKKMRSVCYATQVNRAELVRAMSSLTRERAAWAAQREALARESAERFHPERCVRAHATLLRELGARHA
jgi:glycosyltransferase involved in cell wall biosynthesis